MNALGYSPDWPAPPGVRAWQTTRGAGVSLGTYAGLNLASHVGDRPEDVAANRVRLSASLGLPSEPVWLEQVHGSRVVDLDRAELGPADGAVTARPGVVCTVLTADCLPVLLAERHGRKIGVAHAGWRGLAAGVLSAAVAAFACEPTEIQAWLGPAIGQSQFEVGPEVRAAFLARDSSAAQAFAENARGRWQADLYRLARMDLERAGVLAVSGGGACTHADAARYFSHRREAPCGRMATLIWLETA
jgi:hypothetical protein